MRDQLQSLRFTAAQCGARLTKLQITKPRIAQSFEPTRDLRERAKELDRFIDAQLQHLRDIFSPILNIERLAIEAAAAGLLRCRTVCTAGNRHSRTSVLLPEPLTPVTTTKRFSGNSTVRSFRLFCAASRNTSALA